MSYIYCYKYEFDNFEYPFKFKLRFRNGIKFKFLNNYYQYYFSPKGKEQLLYCYCLLSEKDEEKAKKNILLSNNVLEYICMAPISDRNTFVKCINNEDDINFNIICKNINKLKTISDKILRFKVERNLFEEVMGLNTVALTNYVNNNIEDSFLYYFKIIEKISKKNYLKFCEKKYTKQMKRSNKRVLYNFIENYLNDNLKVKMTDNMLRTSTDEIYKNLRQLAYNSIFSKISFFYKCKDLSIDLEKLSQMVKTRNKLAHGDFVDNKNLIELLGYTTWVSNECISLYFFRKEYGDIYSDTDTYQDDL